MRPGYKQTESGVIPEQWKIANLKQVAEVGAGINKPVSEMGTGALYVTVQDLYAGTSIRTSRLGRIKVTPAELERKSLTVGDIVFGKSSVKRDGIGYPSQFLGCAEPVVYSGFTYRARARHGTTDPTFLFYALRADETRRWIIDNSQSSALTNINQTIADAIPIRLPQTVSEQRAIATALSDVDALLGGLDRLIAKKRDLKQAAMQQLLTGQTRLPSFHGEWEVKRLGDVAEIVMGQSPSSAYYNTRGNGLPLIQGNTDVSNRKTVPRVFTTEVTKRARAGDILMSVRAPVGEVSHVTFDACLGRGVCAIRFPNNFLYHYLVFLEPTWAKHSKGSTFDSVNSNDVKAVEIEFPMDVDEQAVIASVLSDMDTELAALEARRDKTRDLKQAMMQELLTGKTRLVAVGGAPA